MTYSFDKNNFSISWNNWLHDMSILWNMRTAKNQKDLNLADRLYVARMLFTEFRDGFFSYVSVRCLDEKLFFSSHNHIFPHKFFNSASLKVIIWIYLDIIHTWTISGTQLWNLAKISDLHHSLILSFWFRIMVVDPSLIYSQ